MPGDADPINDFAKVVASITRLAEWAIESETRTRAIAEQVSRQYRAIEALTEQLEQAATRDDLDSLRSELRGLVGQPFDA